MNNINNYKKFYRSIDAPEGLRENIIRVPRQKERNISRGLTVTGISAAAVLLAIWIICLLTLKTDPGRHEVITQDNGIKVNEDTMPEAASLEQLSADADTADKEQRLSGNPGTTDNEKPSLQSIEINWDPIFLTVSDDQRAAAVKENNNAAVSDNYTAAADQLPLSGSTAADQGIFVGQIMYQDFADAQSEDAFNDEAEPDIVQSEPPADFYEDQPGADVSYDYADFDPENPDWSSLKDHDTFTPIVDYDPMLFNDKERPIYESCDHEWIQADWGDGHMVTECSKCHVTLNQWLYNGYSE